MLAYKYKNRDGSVCDEIHLNPKHIAVVTCRNTGPSYEYYAETVGGRIWEIDMMTYNRIAAWMEKSDLLTVQSSNSPRRAGTGTALAGTHGATLRGTGTCSIWLANWKR